MLLSAGGMASAAWDRFPADGGGARTIKDPQSAPAPQSRTRPVAWFPTTRTGKVALALAYLTVLSPAWVLLILGRAVFMAGVADVVVIAMLVATVLMLWVSLLRAKERSLLVAGFTVILSAALMYFLWWVTMTPGGTA